jgi:hypothetical protein
MKYRHRICLFSTFMMVLCAVTDSGSVLAGKTSSRPRRHIRVKNSNKPLDLIAIPEEEEWLALVAAPIAARIKNQRKMPIVVVVPSDPSEKQRRLIEQLKFKSNSFAVFSQNPNRDLFDAPDYSPVRLQVARPNLTQTSILLVKSYWEKADTAVIAFTREPEAAILASTLAAHLCMPFIPYESRRSSGELSRALDALDVKTVLFCTNELDDDESVTSSRLGHFASFRQKVEFLNCPTINRRIINLLKIKNIHNLILTRVPEPESDVGAQSWIGPYLSVMRGAPVVLCSSSDGITAEEQVYALIMSNSLRPRTLTILGDYDSIGSITVRDEENLDDYELNVDPCSRPLQGAAAMGVGRIPFTELWACSVMLARGLAREYILQNSKPQVLMVANPNSQYGSLPLAETVSRATAEEFKNLKITINEFYGVGSNSPDIVEAAKKAHLIIYQGHISDQQLFQDPSDIFEFEEGYEEDLEYITSDDLIVNSAVSGEDTICVSDETSSDFSSNQTNVYGDLPISLSSEVGISLLESYDQIEQLEGLPLIVLQSCHSLEEDIANKVFNLGGIGMVGSVTNIHSASGSAFIKAFCDGLLYRSDTVGEALRDARNYFLCLTELKRKRNHTQMAKVYRVALSFCLWGDPELRFTTDLTKRPRRRLVSATFIDHDTIRISTPKIRLPQSRTIKYFIRNFPGSEVAGIVKRIKNEEIRRIKPIYFSRLPLPNKFDRHKYTNLHRDGESDDRTAFSIDPMGRYIYILYFPEKETKGEKFELLFTNK